MAASWVRPKTSPLGACAQKIVVQRQAAGGTGGVGLYVVHGSNLSFLIAFAYLALLWHWAYLEFRRSRSHGGTSSGDWSAGVSDK